MSLQRSHRRRPARTHHSLLIATVCLPVCLAGAACAPKLASSGTPASGSLPADGMSAGKALARAREAIMSKDLAAALHYYELVIANGKLDNRRAEALFGSGMLLIDPDPGTRDFAKARARLEELGRLYPGDSFHVGATVALDVIEETGQRQAEVSKLHDENQKAEEAWKREKEQLLDKIRVATGETEKFMGAAAEERKRAEGLQSVLAGNDLELQQLRADLAAKDEALNKALRRVKGALVRQGAGSARDAGTVKAGIIGGATVGAGATGATAKSGSSGATSETHDAAVPRPNGKGETPQ